MLQGDWSSDVCSSDLGRPGAGADLDPQVDPGATDPVPLPRERPAPLRSPHGPGASRPALPTGGYQPAHERLPGGDRKSTRLYSSHLVISYAVFFLRKT